MVAVAIGALLLGEVAGDCEVPEIDARLVYRQRWSVIAELRGWRWYCAYVSACAPLAAFSMNRDPYLLCLADVQLYRAVSNDVHA